MKKRTLLWLFIVTLYAIAFAGAAYIGWNMALYAVRGWLAG